MITIQNFANIFGYFNLKYGVSKNHNFSIANTLYMNIRLVILKVLTE